MTTVIEDITATGIVAIIRKEENNGVFSSLVATWFTTILLCIMFLFIFGLQSPQKAHAATYTVSIYPEQQYQTIEGWGTTLAWWANIIGGWSDSQRNAVANV